MNMLKRILLLMIFFAGSLSMFSQKVQTVFSSPEFRSLEFKTGMGMNSGVIPLNVIYQRNIKKNLSAVFFSDLGVPSPFINSPGIYIKSTYFHWVEAVGIGGTFGKKRFNNSIFLLGGGRYYYSKLTTTEDIQEPVLITGKLLPELGFLYNLKIGQKKFYFTTQLYIPLYPFKMFASLEANTTLTLGVGYRIQSK